MLTVINLSFIQNNMSNFDNTINYTTTIKTRNYDSPALFLSSKVAWFSTSLPLSLGNVYSQYELLGVFLDYLKPFERPHTKESNNKFALPGIIKNAKHMVHFIWKTKGARIGVCSLFSFYSVHQMRWFSIEIKICFNRVILTSLLLLTVAS